jgi:predicted nucleic acid-binding protein
MNDKPIFLDSNIVIYALTSDDNKKQIALDLMYLEQAMISTQVLNECSNILRKKFSLSYTKIAEITDNYLDMVHVVEISVQTIQKAWKIGDKYRFSYYDSLIIASALENNCAVLYSEDMQNYQLIDNTMRIINPF